MRPRDKKAAELYLEKLKAEQRLLLLKICFSVIKVISPLLPLIDKYWHKIVAMLE